MYRTYLKPALPHLCAIVVFVIISVAYFSPEIFEGKTILGHDSRQGTSQEIVEYRAQTGKTPRWTNAMFSGMPTYQIAPSYKTDACMKFLQRVYTLFLPDPVSYVFILMLGFYILLCVMGARSDIAVLGAIGYAFSSYFFIIIMAGHIWKVLALAFIPPTLAGMMLVYRGKYLGGGLVMAIFLMFQIKSNHLQMSYYSCFIMGAYVLWVLVESIRTHKGVDFAKATGVCILAFLLAAAVNSPNLYHTYEYSKESMRGMSELKTEGNTEVKSGLDRDYMTQWSYGIGETWSLLVPDVKGGATGYIGKEAAQKAPRQYRQTIAQQNRYWGDQPFTSGPVYAGAFFMTLFVLALFLLPGRLKWFLLAVTVITVFLSWGRNMMWFTNLFADYFPLYAKFRSVSSILVVTELIIPLLAALVVVEMVKNPNLLYQKRKALWISFGLTGGISLLFALFPGLFFRFLSGQESSYLLPQMAKDRQLAEVVNALEQVRMSIFRSDAWRSVIVIAIGGVLMFLFARKKIKSTVFVPGVILLCLVDMWAVDKRYLNSEQFIPRQDTKNFAVSYPKSQADKDILQDKDPYYRVYNLTTNSFNDGATSFYHKHIGGYHAAKLGRYQDLIEHQISKGNPQVINMLNTKYFIVPDANRQPQAQLNPDALGNGWFVEEIKWVDNANEEMAALDDFNPAHTAVMDKSFAALFQGKSITADSTASVRLTSYSPEELRYNVSSQTGGAVVFSEIYYPHGWKATIDGVQTPIARTDYVLRAIYVPAGSHEVILSFNPTSVRTTETIARCGFGVFAIVILLNIGMAYHRRRRGSQQG
ncbi:MAG: YfhO family protein [Porphyromonadaceae bacterium]|nr:YfhO family protein [Porphyromonadaceae bacterium]